MTLPSPDSFDPPRAQGLLRSRAMRVLAPHWGALLALALFLIVGLAVLDDYGVTNDEPPIRSETNAVLQYIQGEQAAPPPGQDFLSFYGTAFQLALTLAERAFDLQEVRGIYLSRHLLTHLLFLVGGLFAYLLARRLFCARIPAVAAMLLFLLHPRLYAHSFFNGADSPFAALFVVALFLTHRAFSGGKISGFVLLGVGVGALVNLRITGIILLAAVPAMLALDFAFARRWAKRKRILLAGGAFALASGLTFNALHPEFWPNPFARADEWWFEFSKNAHEPQELFRGLLGRSVDFPEYAPVWFSIASPPFALLLGLIGAALILLRAAKAPREAFRNTRLRFEIMLVGCFALPILAVVIASLPVYQGWRHLHFLWAPFSLLGAFGLAALSVALTRTRLRAAVYGAASAGLGTTAISMALIHPNEQMFFNFSVDRIQQDSLRSQYHMEHWGNAVRQGFEWLIQSDAISSGADIASRDRYRVNLDILPSDDREKIGWNPGPDAFVIRHVSLERPDRAVYRARVYNNTIMTIERKDDLRAIYAATQGREPDVADAYGAYRLGDAVAVVMEPCAPSFLTETAVILRATPDDPADLPPQREGKRFEPLNFRLVEHGAFFDGKCVASLPLPEYSVAEFDIEWLPELLDDNAARDAISRAKAEGRPLARSAYDLYLANGDLVYVKEPCDPLDTEPVFHLDAFPVRASDLPQERRERGYERFHFRFYRNGAFFDGACAAFFPLPDYPIAAVRTGQKLEDVDGDLWSATFSMNPEPYATAYRAVAGSDPLARGAFDLHLLDGDLVYVKEPCEQADTEARFFLHVVPERVGDLREARRDSGFDNLDFRFFLNGAWFDGQCAARVPLPPYPIASVRTGQYVSGAGEIWRAEFAVGS